MVRDNWNKTLRVPEREIDLLVWRFCLVFMNLRDREVTDQSEDHLRQDQYEQTRAKVMGCGLKSNGRCDPIILTK